MNRRSMDWPQILTLLGGLGGILYGLFHQFDKRFEQIDKRIDDLRADTTSRLERIERLLERLLKPELSR
ncbi:MAG: hypothetical protein PHO89_07225 [Methylacidiphilaceae bacterium]|nr:hypothetical protein [Candidatus Methylacidiphilaceae bacterium]